MWLWLNSEFVVKSRQVVGQVLSQPANLAQQHATQQSVHLTLGILRQSQAVFHALSFFQLDGFAVPAPAQVTQTVRPPLAKLVFYNKKNRLVG